MKWQATKFPTMEITTNIAPKGCVVDCLFCPQRVLERSYDSTRVLSLEDFKNVCVMLPKEVRITFAGFTEPFLNKRCTDMVLYAHESGHPVSVFTTGVGMKPEDVHRLKDIPYDGGPNGGFCLHLPDAQRIAKHPINDNFIKTMEAFASVKIKNFYTMTMGTSMHPSVAGLFNWASIPNFWNRAGNLKHEFDLKPELATVWDRVLHAPEHQEPKTCGCEEKLYHNVMLPNGDVSLCCMDYGLKFILGNIFTQDYEDIIPVDGTCFDLCRSCENGV